MLIFKRLAPKKRLKDNAKMLPRLSYFLQNSLDSGPRNQGFHSRAISSTIAASPGNDVCVTSLVRTCVSTLGGVSTLAAVFSPVDLDEEKPDSACASFSPLPRLSGSGFGVESRVSGIYQCTVIFSLDFHHMS